MVTCYNDDGSSSAIGIAASACEDLEAALGSFGSSMSHDSRIALNALLQTLEAGLKGELPPSYFLSSIDPGNGKTLAVSKFLKAWKANGFLPAGGVLLCVSRLAEIGPYLAHAGLDRDEVAILTGDKAANALGADPERHRECPVTITTQQRIARRGRKALMADLEEFYFRDGPRQLRIWDESALLAEGVTVSVDDLGALAGPMGAKRRQFVDDLREFQKVLWAAESGSVVIVPDEFGTAQVAASLSPDRRETLEALKALAGSEVRLVDVKNGDVRMCGASAALPADFAPAVILDASGRVRATYDLWDRKVGGLQRLPSAHNDYSDLSIHLWQRGVGRESLSAPKVRKDIAQAIAEAIKIGPPEPWVLLHYKAAGELFDAVRNLLPSDRAALLRSLTWGNHHGTNRHADVENIVVVGHLAYGSHGTAALASAATGGGAAELSDEERQELEEGEMAHQLLQAVCRTSVRKARNGRAGRGKAYLVLSGRAGLPSLLRRCFPGAGVEEWGPAVSQPLTGQAAELLSFLDKCFAADPEAAVSKQSAARRLGIKSSHLSRLLKRPDVVAAIEDERHLEVDLRTFRRATMAPYPGGGFRVDDLDEPDAKETT